MTDIPKKVRHYYWLCEHFFKKHAKLLSISVVASFFLIVLAINTFPFVTSLLFKHREKIGVVGRYTLSTIPTTITSTLSNPLININEKGELTPVLINTWEITDDSKTYVFHLKPNLYWSSGEKFTARDIDFRFEGITLEVIDDTTIKFKLQQPLSIFPVYLTKPLLKFPLKGVAGMYQLQSFKTGKNNYLSSLHLTPNRPDLPYISYRFFDTEDELIASYKKGEITSMETTKKNIAEVFNKWKNTTITKKTNYNQILTLFFNTASGIPAERDMRKAVAFATPRFPDLGVEALGPIPPVSWAYAPNLKSYPYDPDKAKELFKKNFSASESAELNFYTFYDYLNIAEEIKKNLETAGFRINLKVTSYIPSDFDLLLALWNPPSDPDQYYFWHSTQKDENITNYKNVKIDKLLEDGRKFTNIDERKKIYKDFQETITDDLPAFFVYYPHVYTLSRK